MLTVPLQMANRKTLPQASTAPVFLASYIGT
jgi:hypothetical protein